MQTINIHEAKTHFSKLVDAVMEGDEVIIAKAGKPAVKLVRLKQPKRFRLGVLKGKIKISKDFDESLPDDLLSAFEGEF